MITISDCRLPLALLNTPIITSDGTYTLTSLTLDEAKNIVARAEGNILSAIGHEATAQVMTELLGVEVPVNRIQFEQQLGQCALVFKLAGRIPEGKVLTRQEIELIGFSFKLLVRER